VRDVLDDKKTLAPKALAIAGAFYFFIRSNNSPYRPSIPGTTEQKIDKKRSLK
jgi:hypothetical protein